MITLAERTTLLDRYNELRGLVEVLAVRTHTVLAEHELPPAVAEILEDVTTMATVWGGPACRVCGCTEGYACEEGCAWAEPDLCTECAAEQRPREDDELPGRVVEVLEAGRGMATALERAGIGTDAINAWARSVWRLRSHGPGLPLRDALTLRPEVRAFARLMEMALDPPEQLLEDAGDDIEGLLSGLRRSVDVLDAVFARPGSTDRDDVRQGAAEIALWAMRLVDVAGALTYPKLADPGTVPPEAQAAAEAWAHERIAAVKAADDGWRWAIVELMGHVSYGCEVRDLPGGCLELRVPEQPWEKWSTAEDYDDDGNPVTYRVPPHVVPSFELTVGPGALYRMESVPKEVGLAHHMRSVRQLQHPSGYQPPRETFDEPPEPRPGMVAWYGNGPDDLASCRVIAVTDEHIEFEGDGYRQRDQWLAELHQVDADDMVLWSAGGNIAGAIPW